MYSSIIINWKKKILFNIFLSDVKSRVQFQYYIKSRFRFQTEGNLRWNTLALYQSLPIRRLTRMGGHARKRRRRLPGDNTSRGA